ncbi:MAG: Tex family protein [Chloroflexota bacterium]
MDFNNAIASQLGIRTEQASAAIELLDAGNTIPFIARYRKEATRNLDEEQLRQVSSLLEKLRALEERRAAVLLSIEEQGKLTPELKAEIDGAGTLTALEDLYQPYRPKRRTRAGIAREKGLQPLADLILQQQSQGDRLEQLAAPFLNEQVPGDEDAWAGAMDIVAETISDHPEVRRVTRERALQFGSAASGLVEDAKDEKRVYELYYEFEMRVDRLRPHQVLAINRGEAEKVLRVKVEVPERDWRTAVEAVFRPDPRSPLKGLLEQAANDAAERLLLPAIERDVRRELTERAEAHAIGVFAENLRALLSQPPLAGHTVLGLDPGFRTGCKVAVVDPTGKLLDTDTIYPHEPQKKWEDALKTLLRMVARHKVTLVTIGNGTASRETEQLAAELITRLSGVKEAAAPVKYLIVSEAGASVYSASPLARSEFPELDVSLRGAVSIARRAQDPLAELVKIDPRSIGVGMYQHDVDQKALSGSLEGVVESAVNQVGVDVNTASPALLTHVAGIGPKLAEKIVEHRNTNGAFKDRKALKKVSGLGPKAFEQSAGFLRIHDGANPLDGSAIHPESYTVAQAVLDRAGLSLKTPPRERIPALAALLKKQPVDQLSRELGAGVPTLKDIFEQLVRPGRDPRQDAPAPILRSDVLKMEDLAVGMTLKGTVRNVIDFGAFVDIGVKHDGLLHRTQIPAGTVLKVGDVIQVEIQKVEIERGRVSLGWVKK